MSRFTFFSLETPFKSEPSAVFESSKANGLTISHGEERISRDSWWKDEARLFTRYYQERALKKQAEKCTYIYIYIHIEGERERERGGMKESFETVDV